MTAYLFVESNTTGTGALAVERILAAGDEVVFFTRSPEKYPFLRSPAAGLRVVEVETNHFDDLADTLGRFVSRSDSVAILTFSEFFVEVTARVAERLGLRFLNPEAAAICRNKPRTRRALADAGLATPRHQLLVSPAEASALAETTRYPLVLKPPSDSSSHGVRLVRDATELMAHFRHLSSWSRNVRGQPLDGAVLAEEFLEGPELSVETFTVPGRGTVPIGVADKHLSEPPHFVELGHDFPSSIAADRRRRLIETTCRALDAVGFDFGPAHTELRWTRRGPVVVEINPRLAGGMIPELVRHALGIDLIREWLALAAGREVALEPVRDGFASIRFLVAPTAGRLAAVHGEEDARRLPGIRSVEIRRQPGDRVEPAVDTYGRLGSVLAAGEDPRAVREVVELARRAVRLCIEAEEPVELGEERAV